MTLEKSTQQSIEVIKQNEKTTSFELYSEIGEKLYLISIQYIKKYDMFVMYYTPIEEVVYSFISSLLIYLLIYIGVTIVLWQLFKYIDKKDMLLVQQSKMAMAGEMIGMIAHQFKQPLSVFSMIAGNQRASIELEMEMTNDQILEDSDRIMDQVEYLDKTINTFRDFLKPDNTTEEITIEEVIESSLVIIEKSLSNNNIKIEKEFCSTQKINTNKSELMQVFINLINNSKDAFKINNIESRIISLKTYDKEKTVIIEIEDTAGGIHENKIGDIFNAYFTTKEESGGTGLGLYIVKTIIEEHNNGAIAVKNTENGVKFIITLTVITKN